MTVSPAVTETVVLLTGTTLGPFSTVWPYEQTSDVDVWLDPGTGVYARLELGATFGLAATDTLDAGGQVTLSAIVLATLGAAWPSNAKLAMVRRSSADQPASFSDDGQFDPASLEEALDHGERQRQEDRTAALRTLHFPYGETGWRLPTATSRADSVIAFDDFGQPYLLPVAAAPSQGRPTATVAGPLVRGGRVVPRSWPEGLAWANDTSFMVGFAAAAGTKGGQNGPVYRVTNSGADASLVGSFVWAFKQVLLNGVGQVVFDMDGIFDIDLNSQELSELIPTNPAVTVQLRMTIAAPGFNVILRGPKTLQRLWVQGVDIIIRGVLLAEAIGPNGGDDFACGDGWQLAGHSPAILASADGVTTAFSGSLPTPPIKQVTPSVIATIAGAQVATDDGQGALYGATCSGTINYATGAYALTFLAGHAPAAAAVISAATTSVAALPVKTQQTTTLGTGNASTLTFTGVIPNAPLLQSTPSCTVIEAVQIGYAGSSGAVTGTGVGGAFNWASGALAVAFAQAPAAGVKVFASTVYNTGSSSPQLTQIGTGDGVTTTFSGTVPNALNLVLSAGMGVLAGRPVATDDGLGDLYGHDAAGQPVTGSLSYATGLVQLSFASPPTAGADLAATFSSRAQPVGDGGHIVPAWISGGQVYTSDKICFDLCGFIQQGDGLADWASSAIRPGQPACRGTMSRCMFLKHDKAIATGADTSYPLGTDPMLHLTVYACVFEGVGSRKIRVGPLVIADVVGCVDTLSPYIRPDGSNGLITGIEVSDSSALCISRGNYWRMGYAPSNALPAPTQAAGIASGSLVGAFVDIGSRAEPGTGGIGPNTNVATLYGLGYTDASGAPTLPYDLPTPTVPADAADLQAYVTSRYQQAGVGDLTWRDRLYKLVDQATGDARGLSVDGLNIVASPEDGGYLECVAGGSEPETPLAPGAVSLVFPSLGILTPDGSNNLYLPDPGDDQPYWQVAAASGSLAVVANMAPNGWTPADGTICFFGPYNAQEGLQHVGGTGVIVAGQPIGAVTLINDEVLYSTGVVAFQWQAASQSWKPWQGAAPITSTYSPTAVLVTSSSDQVSAVGLIYAVSGSALSIDGPLNFTAASLSPAVRQFKLPLPIGQITASGKITGTLLAFSSTGATFGGPVTLSSDNLVLCTVTPPDTGTHSYILQLRGILR